MPQLPITTLELSQFRSFRELKVGPFGRVNLITGRNNSGKSSILEAIRLLVTEGALSSLSAILNYREELGSVTTESPLGPPDSSAYCSLFTGFPTLSQCTQALKLTNTGGGNSRVQSLEISVGWYVEEFDTENRTARIVPGVERDLFGETIGFPVLEINGTNRKRKIRLDSRRSLAAREMMDGPELSRIPCIYLDSFSSRSTSQLGALWDAIALTGGEADVLDALRIISPDIENVAMISGRGGEPTRFAIVKSRKFPTPVPLRSFGDGLNRLFGLVLSLANASNGVLLVDEIENGFHYSLQPAVWKVIFQMAAKLNIQVFATTHSWDCIKGFQEAAVEHPEQGVLAKIAVKEDKVLSAIFSEEELSIATQNQIELR